MDFKIPSLSFEGVIVITFRGDIGSLSTVNFDISWSLASILTDKFSRSFNFSGRFRNSSIAEIATWLRNGGSDAEKQYPKTSLVM